MTRKTGLAALSPGSPIPSPGLPGVTVTQADALSHASNGLLPEAT